MEELMVGISYRKKKEKPLAGRKKEKKKRRERSLRWLLLT